MKRETTITSKYYLFYKSLVVVLAVLFFSLYFYTFFARGERNTYVGILFFLGYVFLIWRYWYPSFVKVIKGFRKVSYDDQYFYVEEEQQDLQIPFYRVKYIEIMSLDGVYKIELFDEMPFGKCFYVKPSIWYPLNYKKIDQKFQELRSMIQRSKRAYYDVSAGNQLNSFN